MRLFNGFMFYLPMRDDALQVWGDGFTLWKTTNSCSLRKSQVDKEINHAGASLDSDRWLTFGWWRAPLFLWEPKEGKEALEKFTSCGGGGGGASKVSNCPVEYKPRLEATVRFQVPFMSADGKRGKISVFLEWKGEKGSPGKPWSCQNPVATVIWCA